MSDTNNFVLEKELYAIATDPIYIGTGGYTIGRVDNTIIREPTTKIPKIPGSSLAGTWRYYVALEAHKYFSTDEYKKKRSSRQGKSLQTIFVANAPEWITNFEGNKYIAIKCAGQDEESQKTVEESQNIDIGHCGHCLVCKAFGYSKKDKSWHGMLFFSDLNILFFPVYTRLGTKWITSLKILMETNLVNSNKETETNIVFVQDKIEQDKEKGFINLGWLNLPYEVKDFSIDFSKIKNSDFELKSEDIIIVPDSLISQIINSNLEVRTSVSIDPITGSAKEGALFTSEAIPRGTIFFGKIRIFDKKQLGDNNLPTKECILESLEDSKKYYETLGIGGMTTRGFGRMKILTNLEEDTTNGGNNNGS